jgi:hypothetical protein
MKPFSILGRRVLRRNGFAIVVALAAIVLLTVIVLAFFSKALLNRQISFTSTNQIKSDMLARTALDIVIGEIRQEIVDYSHPPTNGTYQPLNAINMVPIKTGVTSADTNTGAFTIAKVGAAETKINPHANGKAFGSAVTLDTKSRNGRTLAQWFAAGPQLGTSALPTWTYLSRAGSIVTNFSAASKNPIGTNNVTGRFSFTVYNVGGLLDANVAGYPSTATNLASSKVSAVFADLTTLGLSPTEVDELVMWRNASTATNASLFNAWATGLNPTNTPASKGAARAAADGYLSTPVGDNAFFSRRDLIRFFTTKATSAAIPAFTHFSRALTAASIGPSTPAGSSIDYAKKAGEDDGINRLFPEVKAFDGVITDYADDGTPTERKVSANEPLVQKKFSLAKLAWLGHDGPNASAFASHLSSADRALAIKTCFGLTWVPNSNPAGQPSNARWDYNHGSDADILLLEEVRQAKRAPDFFELLKGGILSGSLGAQPGVVAENIASSNPAHWQGPIGRDFETYSADEDRHILQIGANIIDQADADNYPTAIHMDLIKRFAGSERRFFNTVFGVENLPMLQRMGVINSMLTDHTESAPYPSGKMAVWMQPEVWNPNHPATAGTSPSDPNYPTPSSLRITTYGSSYVWNAGQDTEPGDEPMVVFGVDYDNPVIDGIICFKNPSPTSTQPRNFFDKPATIKGYSKAQASVNYTDTTSPSGPRNRYPDGFNWPTTSLNSNQFIGVFTGECDHDPGAAPDYDIRPMIDGYLTFVMEYYDGSTWHPYCSLSRLETLHSNSGGKNSVEGGPFILSIDGQVDPRTSRFSGSALRTSTSNNPGWFPGATVRPAPNSAIGTGNTPGRGLITHAWPRPLAGNDSDPATSARFFHTPVGGNYLFDSWAVNLAEAVDDKPVSDFRYADPDGVTRPGDSWRADYSTGDGILTYHSDVLTATAQRRRPVILNRPFRSVGELGYVFRDLPFKTLDLWSKDSADAAILDLFAVSDQSSVSGGKININVAPPSTLRAMFTGASDQAFATSTLSNSLSSALADSIAGSSSTNVLKDPAELPAKWGSSVYQALTNSTSDTWYQNKSYGEAPIRALANVNSVRTWNLLVDVVAQAGKLAANATALNDFIVEGERRYWMHIAIDRFSGEVIDTQLEIVNE